MLLLLLNDFLLFCLVVAFTDPLDLFRVIGYVANFIRPLFLLKYVKTLRKDKSLTNRAPHGILASEIKLIILLILAGSISF